MIINQCPIPLVVVVVLAARMASNRNVGDERPSARPVRSTHASVRLA